jgi:uncharacterized protein YjbI with pentapeptide repeats
MALCAASVAVTGGFILFYFASTLAPAFFARPWKTFGTVDSAITAVLLGMPAVGAAVCWWLRKNFFVTMVALLLASALLVTSSVIFVQSAFWDTGPTLIAGQVVIFTALLAPAVVLGLQFGMLGIGMLWEVLRTMAGNPGAVSKQQLAIRNSRIRESVRGYLRTIRTNAFQLAQDDIAIFLEPEDGGGHPARYASLKDTCTTAWRMYFSDGCQETINLSDQTLEKALFITDGIYPSGLKSADFSRAKISYSHWYNNTLVDCTFDGADLSHCVFLNLHAPGTTFKNADLTGSVFYFSCCGLESQAIDLTEANLHGCRFDLDLDLRRSTAFIFRDARLDNCHFIGSQEAIASVKDALSDAQKQTAIFTIHKPKHVRLTDGSLLRIPKNALLDRGVREGWLQLDDEFQGKDGKWTPVRELPDMASFTNIRTGFGSAFRSIAGVVGAIFGAVASIGWAGGWLGDWIGMPYGVGMSFAVVAAIGIGVILIRSSPAIGTLGWLIGITILGRLTGGENIQDYFSIAGISHLLEFIVAVLKFAVAILMIAATGALASALVAGGAGYVAGYLAGPLFRSRYRLPEAHTQPPCLLLREM